MLLLRVVPLFLHASDVTVTSQQYTVQMVTSGVPPIRLLSNIDCTSNCDGTTFGQSYYILINLTALQK